MIAQVPSRTIINAMLTALLPFPTLVQLERHVATVESVVAELARKSGQDLRIKREMKDEVLYVSLKAHEPGELKLLIAKASSAEWTEDAGHIYLGRSALLKQRQEREDQATLATELTRAIAPRLVPDDWLPLVNRTRTARSVMNRYESVAKDDDGDLSATENIAFTPDGRLLSRILRLVPAEAFAAVSPGETIRFMPVPNRFQRPLPGVINVQQYWKDRQAMADYAETMEGNTFSGSNRATPMLRVSHFLDGLFEFYFGTYDRSGTDVDVIRITLDHNLPHGARDLSGYASWRGKTLDLSPATTSLATSMVEEDGRVEPTLATLMRDPVANEPMGALMSEPMDRLATAVGRETITRLPDESISNVPELIQRHAKLGGFADWLTHSIKFDLLEEALVGHARYPSISTMVKTDREILRGLMRTLAQGAPRLETVARYALAQKPEAGQTDFERLALNAAGFEAMTRPTSKDDTGWPIGVLSPLFDGSRDPIRMYGALSLTQRKILEQGGAVPFVALSATARTALESFLAHGFQDLFPLGVVPPNATDSILPSTTISLNFGSGELMVMPYERQTETFSATALGELLYRNDTSLKADALDVRREKYVLGKREGGGFHVRIPQGVEGLIGYFLDGAFDPTKKAVPFSALPPEYLKAIQVGYDAAKKSKDGG